MKTTLLLLFFLMNCCLVGAVEPDQSRELQNLSWTGETMGGVYSIKIARARIVEEDFRRLKSEVDARLKEVNRQMSHYQPDSELSRFNRHTTSSPFKISNEFAKVIRYSIELNQRSHGAFDPTLGPLIDLWGFGRKGVTFEVPPQERVEKALAVCGCQKLRITGRNELMKTIPELELNLSAVAKGFGVDEAARVVRARGIDNVFVEIGGEVAAFGINASGQPWQVGVETPIPDLSPGESIEAVVPLSGKAIATSGDYRKYFQDANGVKYSHILNPKTGRPVHHNMVSVSVVAENCLAARWLGYHSVRHGPRRRTSLDRNRDQLFSPLHRRRKGWPA